jgi:hypothetical protein
VTVLDVATRRLRPAATVHCAVASRSAVAGMLDVATLRRAEGGVGGARGEARRSQRFIASAVASTASLDRHASRAS